MQIKFFSAYIFFLLITFFLAAYAECTIISISNNSLKIQDAIDSSSPGDIIEIHGDTYNESLVIEKPLTLRGMKAKEIDPVIESNCIGSTIKAKSDNIIIEHIKIKSSKKLQNRIGISAGIMLLSSNNTIRDNEISVEGGYGVYLNGSGGNLITNNNISGNEWGICLERSISNVISDNNISYNKDAGFWIEKSKNNTIKNNTIIMNHCGFKYDTYEPPYKYNMILENKMNNYPDYQNIGSYQLPEDTPG